MSLLVDVQNAAVDGLSDLPSLLRKCRLLAHRLEHEPLAHWVDRELDGYASSTDLPEYRVLRTHTVGNFVGMFGRQIPGGQVPAGVLGPENAEFFTTVKLRLGMGTYAEFIKADRDLQESLPAELAFKLSYKVYADMECLGAWKVIPRAALVGVVDAVRNRILRFAMDLERVNPAAGEVAAPLTPLPTVSHIFNMHITGGSHNIATGSHGFSQFVQQQPSVRVGDKESLAQYARSLGVPEGKIEELIAATSDAQKGGQLPARVQSWLGQMATLGAKGVWEVGKGTVIELLTKGVLTYYGIKG